MFILYLPKFKRISYMVCYQVALKSEEYEIDTTIDCNDNIYLLGVAEEQRVELL